MRHPRNIWVDFTHRTCEKNEHAFHISKEPNDRDARYVEVNRSIPDDHQVVAIDLLELLNTSNESTAIQDQRWFRWAYFQMAAERSYAVSFDFINGVGYIPAHQIQNTIDWILDQFELDSVQQERENNE